MPRPKKGEPNKSEFIRKHPGIPVGDLVGKAKAAGMTIDSRLVHKVRSRDGKKGPKKKASAAPAQKATTAKKAAPKSAPPTATGKRGPGRPKKVQPTTNRQDSAFRQLVIDMGVNRAKALVSEVEQAIDRILGA